MEVCLRFARHLAWIEDTVESTWFSRWWISGCCLGRSISQNLSGAWLPERSHLPLSHHRGPDDAAVHLHLLPRDKKVKRMKQLDSIVPQLEVQMVGLDWELRQRRWSSSARLSWSDFFNAFFFGVELHSSYPSFAVLFFVLFCTQLKSSHQYYQTV